MTAITITVPKPYAQSLKNFERMQPYIYAAMSVVLSPNATLNKSLKFNPASFAEPLSPETFSARFRDAVRYGVKYGYSSMLFTPQQLATLSTTMEVSMADSPFVWVYDKKTTPPFKVKEQQSLQEVKDVIAGVGQTSDGSKAQATVTLTVADIEAFNAFLMLKPYFDPPMVVRIIANCNIPSDVIDNWLVVHDCVIQATDTKNEYIVA